MLKDLIIAKVHKLLRADKFANDVFTAAGTSLDKVVDLLKDLEDNFVLFDKATWGLVYHEKELGILTDLAKTYEARRASISAKIRGSGKLDLELINNVCDSWKRADVIVAFANGIIIIKFVDTGGVPENVEDLKAQLEDIKPAHLPIDWQYSYWVAGVFDEWNLTAAEFDAANLTAAEWNVTIHRPV